jgi:hypothetical protein
MNKILALCKFVLINSNHGSLVANVTSKTETAVTSFLFLKKVEQICHPP